MPHLMSIVCSDVSNFAEKAGGDVIYKAAIAIVFGIHGWVRSFWSC
jgi:hypothetical protein